MYRGWALQVKEMYRVIISQVKGMYRGPQGTDITSDKYVDRTDITIKRRNVQGTDTTS